MARGGIRSQILEFLAQHPKRPNGAYWTGYALTKALFPEETHRHESSVWKITTQFSDCHILEPRTRTPVPMATRAVTRVVDAHGHTIESRASAYRMEVPLRFMDLGRRIVELMRFARDQNIFKTEPQREHLTASNSQVLAKFRQGGFTHEEVKTAVDAGLIFEQTIKTYAPQEGFAVAPTAVTMFGPREMDVEYRYKYKLR